MTEEQNKTDMQIKREAFTAGLMPGSYFFIAKDSNDNGHVFYKQVSARGEVSYVKVWRQSKTNISLEKAFMTTSMTLAEIAENYTLFYVLNSNQQNAGGKQSKAKPKSKKSRSRSKAKAKPKAKPKTKSKSNSKAKAKAKPKKVKK